MKNTMNLNFEVDKPTANGRIYPKDVFENAIKKALKGGKGIPVFRDGESRGAGDIIGVIESYSVGDDGSVAMTANMLPDWVLPQIKISTACTGVVGDDNIVEDVELLYTYPVWDNEPSEKG